MCVCVSVSLCVCVSDVGFHPVILPCDYPESSASSPLSWLLSEYLDNAETARRCKSRAAIFNSRVRRLTHLLVHVDTSRTDGEELKPPVKSSEVTHTHTHTHTYICTHMRVCVKM